MPASTNIIPTHVSSRNSQHILRSQVSNQPLTSSYNPPLSKILPQHCEQERKGIRDRHRETELYSPLTSALNKSIYHKAPTSLPH